MELRQRQSERRGEQRDRHDEQSIPARHVSFLSITHGLNVERPRRVTDDACGPGHGEEASWAAETL